MMSARSSNLLRILPRRKFNQGCLSCRETMANRHASARKRSMTSICRTAPAVGQIRVMNINVSNTSLVPMNVNSNHQRCNFLSSDSKAAASGKGEDAEAVTTLERILSKAMAKRVLQMKSRHDEIMSILVQGSGASSGQSNDAKELTHLAPVSRLYNDFISYVEEIESIAELMEQADGDEDMVQECQEEIDTLQSKIEELGAKMQEAVLPKNEDDFGCDAVMEIRAGTGGEEACLFCGELMDAYEKTSKGMGWKFEILSIAKTDLGGIKEAAVAINSSSGGGGGYGGFEDDETEGPPFGPYGYFKFESGVHRVQRVPVNDVRIHTSAASVAVLPAPSDSGAKEDLLPTSELRIETMRASGAGALFAKTGGQHVNTTDSAVRITHIPTGITAAIQDERSQHKNKSKAMKLIAARVRDKVLADEAKERGEAKNALLGGGDRSERIRTYNYPQDRITDHRCKESEFGISKMLAGGTDKDGIVGAFSPFLRDMERKELLATLEEEERRDSRPDTKGKKKR